MRSALKALTIRGRAFLASGVTAILCGVVLLERDLVRMGLLVAALPLISAAYVAGRSHHLRLRRTVQPTHLSVGEVATVVADLRNEGPPTSVLLLEEHLPYALGGRPRFVVLPMPRGGHERLEYSVRPEIRGRHPLGPMQVRLREPFGMVELRQDLPGSDALLVTPRVQALGEIRLGGGWYASGDDHPRSFSIGRVADVVVREYRRGDDLRRVHWRSTARMGELMVRNEEQLWQARATVVLDNRTLAHRGTGPGSSFESAVCAAASIAVHLSGLGYQVRLVTGNDITESTHERGYVLDSFPLLEQLALVDLVREEQLPDLVLGEEVVGGIVVGILGAGRAEDRSWWSRFPRNSAQSLAVVLDVDEWAPGRPAQQAPAGPTPATSPAAPLADSPVAPLAATQPTARDAAYWLARQGWRATTWGKSRSLADSWRDLDR